MGNRQKGTERKIIGNMRMEIDILYISCIQSISYSLLSIPYYLLFILYSQPHNYPILFLTILIKPNNNLKIKSNWMETLSKSSSVINSSSLDKSSKVSSSLAEPSAMYRNCCSSLSDLLAEPSAIFTGIEVQALRICEVSPNLSSIGNFEVTEYRVLTKSKLCFHASRFWCGFISEVVKLFEDTNIKLKVNLFSTYDLRFLISFQFPITNFQINQ